MYIDRDGNFAISILGILIVSALITWTAHDIYQVTSGNVYFNEETGEIVNSSNVQMPIVVYGYSAYLRYFSPYRDYFTGSAGGIAAEWIGHNIAYDVFSITSIFDYGIDERNSAKHAHIGSSIYSESRAEYRLVFTTIQVFISPVGYIYDAYKNGKNVFPIIGPVLPGGLFYD